MSDNYITSAVVHTVEIVHGDPQREVVEIIARGPQGARGPVGPAGNDRHHVHDQAQAAEVWVIEHNLGKWPSVTVVDSAGSECEGDVKHIDTNTVEITFSAAFGGRAFCN